MCSVRLRHWFNLNFFMSLFPRHLPFFFFSKITLWFYYKKISYSYFFNYTKNLVFLFLLCTAINVYLFYFCMEFCFNIFLSLNILPHMSQTFCFLISIVLVVKQCVPKYKQYMWKCFVSYNNIPMGLHVYMLVSRQPRELKNKEFTMVIFSSNSVLMGRKV